MKPALAILFLFIIGSAIAAESRTWTSADGRALEGELLEYSQSEVVVRRNADGRRLTIPLEQLAEKDRAFIAGLIRDKGRDTMLKDGPYASKVTGGFEAGTFENGMLYRFWGSPEFKATERYPLLVFLHGGGSRGSDNEAQLKNAGTAIFVKPEEQEARPCFVLVPQCPLDKSWRGEEYDKVHTLVIDLAEKLPIDENRIYVTGSSLGGSGTWYALAAYPDYYAAGIPSASGGPVADAEKLKDIPIWHFHGELDPDAPVQGARDMAAALKAVGAKSKYTEIEKGPHSIGGIIYGDEEVRKWLFAQKRER